VYPSISYIRRPQTASVIHELDANQWRHSREVSEISWRKLRTVLRYAYDNVPFYHHLFKSIGLNPDDVSMPSDLSRIPVLTRDDLVSNFSQMGSLSTRKGVFEDSTGGSTGHPVKFLKDLEMDVYAAANQFRSQRAMGWNIGEKSAFIWGAERDSPRLEVIGQMRMIAERILWLNSFRMSENQMKQYAHLLTTFKPRIIIGYASSLHLMARFLLKEGIHLPPIMGIQSSAESLFETQRRDIERAFGCRVFDKYGSREFGTISFECAQHSGLHISSDIEYLEFERDGEPVAAGEAGRILVTGLTNFAMPLIRYDIGDFSSPITSECACGRGMPLMAFVKGRTSDIISTPNGNLVHGEFFTHLFYKATGVEQFQVEQISLRKLVIRVVAVPSVFDKKSFIEMEQEIHRFIDPTLEMEFELVDAITPTAAGKHRFTSSKVAPPV
jgi:phenylacetate-CoA ligase